MTVLATVLGLYIYTSIPYPGEKKSAKKDDLLGGLSSSSDSEL